MTTQTAVRPLRRLPWPKRWDVAILCFLAQIIGYCDRVNISVAAPELMRERHWDTVQMGCVFTAFFLGYTLSMIPIGIYMDRYGAKLLLTAGVIWWSVFTVLSRASGFCWSGGYAGSIIAFPLASAIGWLWGWRSIF